MCVQYREGCSLLWGYLEYHGGYLEYHGGCSVPWGYHDKRGRYLDHRGGVHYHGGYHENHGGYFKYSGGCSIQWEDMIHVGVHEYCGDVKYRGGTQITKDDIPLGIEHPTVLKRSPHISHDIPHNTPPSWY